MDYCYVHFPRLASILFPFNLLMGVGESGGCLLVMRFYFRWAGIDITWLRQFMTESQRLKW